MDGGGTAGVRRRRLKERLGLFNAMSCCGASWGPTDSTITETDEEITHSPGNNTEQLNLPPPPTAEDAPCSGEPSPGYMNLGEALAAEREFRAADTVVQEGNEYSPSSTPRRVSLMRLLAESVGGDGYAEEEVAAPMVEAEAEAVGSGVLCCVCMVRKKGAAFIPCGHTYCRVCSRELWVNRGTCPLCNRPISEILDIF